MTLDDFEVRECPMCETIFAIDKKSWEEVGDDYCPSCGTLKMSMPYTNKVEPVGVGKVIAFLRDGTQREFEYKSKAVAMFDRAFTCTQFEVDGEKPLPLADIKSAIVMPVTTV